MIRNFKDDSTQDIFSGVNSKEARKLPQEIWQIAWRKLDMLNAAHEIKDLKSPPGNRLESLKGNLRGYYSIRINDQYRIAFRFAEGHADAVEITDYH